MTFEELTNWIKENNLKCCYAKYWHECYYNDNLFLTYRNNYYGKIELTVFTLKYDNSKNIVAADTAMCKTLENFEKVDFLYYFEEFKKKQVFLQVYTKQKFIERRKYELAKDFNK